MSGPTPRSRERIGLGPLAVLLAGVVLLTVLDPAIRPQEITLSARGHADPAGTWTDPDRTNDSCLTVRIDSLATAGAFEEAVQWAQRQLGLRRASARPDLIAGSLERVGELLVFEGAASRAVEPLQQAVALRRAPSAGGGCELALTLTRLGGALKDAARYEEALTAHREALRIGIACGDAGRIPVARALAGIANVVRRRRVDRPQAVHLLRRALGLLRAAGSADHLQVAGLRQNLALVLLQEGRNHEAQRELDLALPVLEQALGPGHPSLGLALSLRGWLFYRTRRYSDASVALRRALTIYGTARGRAPLGTNRLRYRPHAAQTLAAVLLAQGRSEEAWETLDASLSLYLLELLPAGLGEGPTAGDASHGTTENALERVQCLLPPTSALVGWLDVSLGNDELCESWGYVVRREDPVHWVRLRCAGPEGAEKAGPSTATYAQGHILRDAAWPLAVPDDPLLFEECRSAWRDRFQPLEPFLHGVNQLIVTGEATMLDRLPLEAFVDGQGRLLLERFTISYAHSAAVFASLSGRAGRVPDDGRSRALLVAADVGGDSHGEHNWRLSEVQRIAALMPGAEVLTGSAAGRDRVRALLAERGSRPFGIVHVAGHALNDARLPDRAALVLPNRKARSIPLLSGARRLEAREHGIADLLTAEEIADLPLSPGLVCLSGCWTSGKSDYGGYRGLGDSFLRAGATSVLMTRWRVDDRATALLMCRFYALLVGSSAAVADRAGGDRLPAAEALREAKLWLRDWADEQDRKVYRSPAYWAGFMLMGDPAFRVPASQTSPGEACRSLAPVPFPPLPWSSVPGGVGGPRRMDARFNPWPKQERAAAPS